MKEIPNLEPLGLDQKEALLYTKSLELGKFTVIQISRKTNIKRSTCYLILDSLLQKGLVSIVPQSKKLFYETEKADVLIKQAERNLLLAKKVVPFLNSLQKQSAETPIIKVYSGQNGIRNIYDDIFKSKVKSYKYIGATESVINMAGEDFIKEHIVKRLKNKVKVFGIRIKDKEISEKIYSEEKNYLREIKYAPEGFYIPGILFLYNKKVAFVSSETGNFGFMIEGEDFFKTISAFFDMIWSISNSK